MKTNASRILESLGVPHEVREYPIDLEDLSAPTVARKVGLEPAQVFKTLLAKGDRHGPCFALVAADAELVLKALAKARGDRKAALAPLKELTPLTGYVRGGCTVLGAKRAFGAVADESMLEHELVAVSAGVRGAQIVIEPAAYIEAIEAIVAPIQRR